MAVAIRDWFGSNRDRPEALSAGGVTKRVLAGLQNTVPQYVATPHVRYWWQ